uniref:Sulfotransferase domain-containing protein n=1 Tax=Aureoumbra lagunensis TaxID=44058 RepID=A0A7S3NJN5_9STRA
MNDSECAAAYRLTMNGYIRNQWPLSEVCAPQPLVGSKCHRPPGVLHLYFKLAAGLVMGRQVLGSLFLQPKLIWIESFSLAHVPTRIAFENAKGQEYLIMTVLRYPIDRIVAHFLAASSINLNFSEWVQANSLPAPRRGNDGKSKFWLELDNVYTKVLSGCCNKSNPTPNLIAAQNALDTIFDVVVIAEWLDSPATIAWLADQWLCFPHKQGIISTPRPNFSRSRRYRRSKDEARRAAIFSSSSNFTQIYASVFSDLTLRNQLDLSLYHIAAKRHRAAIQSKWWDENKSPLSLPPLPCTLNAPCWDHFSFPGTTPPM